MAIQCSICQHPKKNQIDRALLLKEPLRSIATRFNIPHFSALYRHKPHVQARIKTAIKKREESAAAQLLADTEFLWFESQQYIEDARNAVKTQAITEGHGKDAKTVYKEYRDVGAMSAALRVGHENRRLFGDATGAMRPQSQESAGPVLYIIMPGLPRSNRADGVTPTVLESVCEPQSESE
jgi:hypothetical protein